MSDAHKLDRLSEFTDGELCEILEIARIATGREDDSPSGSAHFLADALDVPSNHIDAIHRKITKYMKG